MNECGREITAGNVLSCFGAYGALNVGYRRRQRLKGMQGRGRLAREYCNGGNVSVRLRGTWAESGLSPHRRGLPCKSHPKESVMRISTGDCACGATIVSYRGERVWVDNCFSSRRLNLLGRMAARPNGGATNSRRVLIDSPPREAPPAAASSSDPVKRRRPPLWPLPLPTACTPLPQKRQVFPSLRGAGVSARALAPLSMRPLASASGRS